MDWIAVYDSVSLPQCQGTRWSILLICEVSSRSDVTTKTTVKVSLFSAELSDSQREVAHSE